MLLRTGSLSTSPNSNGMVLHYVDIDSPMRIWLNGFLRVFYQIPRADAAYQW